jgi:hypothetical protein
MRCPLILLLTVVIFAPAYAQRTKSPLVCKTATLAALKPKPELKYECNEQLNDYDEKMLKLPARLAAIKSLMSELTSFTEPAWWAADVVDLGVCDYTGKTGTLTRAQRQSFVDGEYLFWLFGNDRIRLLMLSDPCYQTEYGGTNGFVLYRKDGRVSVTQVLDGFFSRADNPVNVAFAKLNGEEIIEISTWSGGLNPSLTNYYFTIDPKTSHAVPKNLFKGDHGPINEISSAMLFNETPASAPLKIVRGQTMALSFSIYIDDERGRIDDNGRTLSRKILRWNGKIYR